MTEFSAIQQLIFTDFSLYVRDSCWNKQSKSEQIDFCGALANAVHNLAYCAKDSESIRHELKQYLMFVTQACERELANNPIYFEKYQTQITELEGYYEAIKRG